MPTTRTAEEIAAELRKIPVDLVGWTDTLIGLCADPFEIVHAPSAPHDGMTTAAAMLELENQVYPVVLQAIPDMEREVGTISVMDDVITFTQASVGTAPDGTRLRIPGVYILTVKDGKIVKIHDWHDPEDLAVLMSAVGQQLVPDA